MVDGGGPEPKREDSGSVRDYVSAHESFHDQRIPSQNDLLVRSVSLASESMRAIDLQLRRIRRRNRKTTGGYSGSGWTTSS